MNLPSILIEHSYRFEKVIGSGSFGNVLLLKSPEGRQIVLKAVSKYGEQTFEEIQREVFAGKTLDSPHIAKMFHAFDDELNWYYMLEYVNGKNLFNYLTEILKANNNNLNFKGKDVKSIFRQLVVALVTAHENGIAHLDIKLENIVIEEETKKVKLIDFGLCHISSYPVLCSRYVGSPDYAAPEILFKRPYDAEKADVWSLGVVLFILMFGRMPFFREERKSLAKIHRHPDILWPDFKKPPKLAKDLIQKMLCIDPEERLSIYEVAKHPYCRKFSFL